MAQGTSAMIAVRNILTRLCKRSGLSAERLRTTEIDVTPLLELPAIHRHVQRTSCTHRQAALPVIRDFARHLPPTHRLITDAELSLGLFRESPPPGIDVEHLYAADLGERRTYLTTHWQHLHRALDAEHIPPTPTVRSLRATPERRAFTALATALTAGTTPRPHTETAPTPTAETTPGVLTVIGDAVIDHIYRVDRVPTRGTSTRGDFEQHPGGKGLNRTVAAARLGLEVRFVSVVGDDDNGHRILNYLHSEKVDTRLIEAVPNATTPVTALIVTSTGETSSIGCKDDRVQLGEPDLTDHRIRNAIADADAVLITFEQPPAVIDKVMAIIRALPVRPLTMVHPAPPVTAPQYLYKHLDTVDYLVGSTWELDLMVPEVAALSGAHIAQQLRTLGVHTVCAIDDFACTVRSDRIDLDIPRYPAVLSDSPGARAAFSAALAYRLLSSRRPAQQPDYAWATAAMAATQSFGDVPGAMPLASEIDRIVTLASEEH